MALDGGSEDEFSDGQSFEYNEAFESQLRIMESQQARTPANPDLPAVTQSDTSLERAADRASATRRKLEHLDISLEQEATESDVVEELVGEENQDLLDVLNISGSQSSKFEEELVQQVTQLIPHTEEASNPESQTEGIRDVSEADTARASALESITEGEESGKGKRSLFRKFRKRGFFSVTDLVAPSWCEVQFDYRLRSKSYLPVAARPDTIQTSTGTVIVLNKEIAGTGEKIMRKGEQVHKKLEREIHPVEIEVKTDSREDVWGLRFLNMLASLEALMTLGKCRELPVVGFIRGYMLVGVIDEITRKPLVTYTKNKKALSSPVVAPEDSTSVQSPSSREKKPQSAKPVKSPSGSKSTDKSQTSDAPHSSSQKTLFAFYRPLRPRPVAPPNISHDRSHVLFVSDSKTRAGGTMPKEENSNNGRMQLMLYKEMLDAMIVEGLRQYAKEQKQRQADGDSSDDVQVITEKVDDEVICIDADDDKMNPSSHTQSRARHEGKAKAVDPTYSSSTIDSFTWADLFDHLALEATQPFTETFLAQSRPLIEGNNLSASVASASNLQQMTSCWAEYVSRLGLGTIDPNLNDAEIENALNEETGGRKIGHSEKLLSLVYRRVGKSRKKKTCRQQSSATDTRRVTGENEGKKRRKRGTDVQEDVEVTSAERLEGMGDPVVVKEESASPSAMEVEEERTLQLAIAESLCIAQAPSISVSDTTDCYPKIKADDNDETLPESLLPPQTFLQAWKQQSATPDRSQTQLTDIAEPTTSKSGSSTSLQEPEILDMDGTIIGSYRFAHLPASLAEHVERVLQFWTGVREPTGVTIENTSRCGWCEFEEGCEWRAAKALEAISKNEALRSARKPASV